MAEDFSLVQRLPFTKSMCAGKSVGTEADVLPEHGFLLQVVESRDPAELRGVIVRCQAQLLRELFVFLIHVDDQHVVRHARRAGASDVAITGVVLFVEPVRFVVRRDRRERLRRKFPPVPPLGDGSQAPDGGGDVQLRLPERDRRRQRPRRRVVHRHVVPRWRRRAAMADDR